MPDIMLYKQSAQTLVRTWLLVRVFWLQIIENLDSSWLRQQGCLLFHRTKTAQGRWSPGMILQAVYSWLILLALPLSMPGFILPLEAMWSQWFQRHIWTQQCSRRKENTSSCVSLLGEGNLFLNSPVPPLQVISLS